jgi:type VI secretion system protein ImpK
LIPAEAMDLATERRGGSYLVRQFWAFYAELVALKRQLGGSAAAITRSRQGAQSPREWALEAGLQPAEPGAGPEAESAPKAPTEPAPEQGGRAAMMAAQSVSRQLIGVLELQAIEAQRAGGRYSLDINHEAQYVMAALADETLLSFDWPGRDVWTSCLIEEALFGSRIAGDRIFDRLDELLRTRDPARRDLALIYLLALSLGFEGRYRGTDCLARMQAYRAAIYRFRTGRDPDPTDRSRQISPQAYGFTVSDALPQEMPHVSRWIAILVLVIVGILGVSQLVWHLKAGPLVEDIRNTAE